MMGYSEQEGPLEATHKATVVGFSRLDCQRCYGRGRTGWLKRENGTVIPCGCVEFFDMDAIRESAAEQPHEKLSGNSAEQSPE